MDVSHFSKMCPIFPFVYSPCGGEVPLIVPVGLLGCLHYKRGPAQFRMVDHSCQRLEAYRALSDMLVPVGVRPEGGRGIVKMDHLYERGAYEGIELLQRIVQSSLRLYVVSGLEYMRGIEAEADFRLAPDIIQHLFYVLKSISEP